MSQPVVSVVIPAWNQAEYLGAAIQSVLDQTYPDFEIIVVNDASPDSTDKTVSAFSNERLKYLVHPVNRGLPAARNTGIRASSGKYIALLDADDLFHPDKLEAHVAFLEQHRDVDVSYNARFELNHSATTIREYWRPATEVRLPDLILGFPFGPSDMVIRREIIFRVGLFDETHIHGAEDIDFPIRLALAGSRFVSVDRGLNYRRYHSGRKRKRLADRKNDYTCALDKVLSDPRCPTEVKALRNQGLANHYIEVAWYALNQEETELGQAVLREAISLYPQILSGNPSELVKKLTIQSILDENEDHASILRRIFQQFPEEISWLQNQYHWAASYGFLRRGLRNMIWGSSERGALSLDRAIELGSQPDQAVLGWAVDQLLHKGAEIGLDESELSLHNLVDYLKQSRFRKAARWLLGCYSFNLAIKSYRAHRFGRVVSLVCKAVVHNPSYLMNRGAMGILLRSMLRTPHLARNAP